MSGAVPKKSLGDLSQFRVAIISASWHEQICADLIAGARRALLEAKIEPEPVIFVPGSFELPLAAQLSLDSGFDAFGSTHKKGDDHVRKDHDIAQWQHR